MTTTDWALSVYMGGIVLAMVAAALVAARKAAFDRVHPHRDPVERYHDGDIPMFLVAAAVMWPIVPLFAIAWLVWRSVVFLFERPIRRRANQEQT